MVWSLRNQYCGVNEFRVSVCISPRPSKSLSNKILKRLWRNDTIVCSLVIGSRPAGCYIQKEKSIKLLQITKAALKEPFFLAASPPLTFIVLQRFVVTVLLGAGRFGQIYLVRVRTIDPGHSDRQSVPIEWKAKVVLRSGPRKLPKPDFSPR